MTIRRAGSESIQQIDIPENRLDSEAEMPETHPTEGETVGKPDSRAAELAGSILSERMLAGYAQKLHFGNLFEKAPKTTDEIREPGSQPTEVKENQGAASIQKTLRPGSKEAEVKTMQTELNRWRAQNGLDPIEVTGTYDKSTDSAVREFQKARGLKTDGVFGPDTRDHLALENDPNFQKLGDTVKGSVRVQMLRFKDQPQARKDLVELATREAFAGSNSLRVQETALVRFAETKSLRDSYSLISNRYALESDPKFQALSPKMKDRIDGELAQSVLRINRDTSDGTEGMQSGLTRVVTSPGFAGLSEAQQEKVLEGLRETQYCGVKSSFKNPEHIRDILDSQNVRDLDDSTKTAVVECAAQYASDGAALQELKLMVLRTEFSQMTPAEQKAAITDFKKRHEEVTIDHD